jgi:DNA-binding XRE family transcriptional regulator
MGYGRLAGLAADKLCQNVAGEGFCGLGFRLDNAVQDGDGALPWREPQVSYVDSKRICVLQLLCRRAAVPFAFQPVEAFPFHAHPLGHPGRVDPLSLPVFPEVEARLRVLVNPCDHARYSTRLTKTRGIRTGHKGVDGCDRIGYTKRMESTHPLRDYRTRHGLTQAELAGSLGVRRETLARWETRVSQPDRALLPTIEAKTGIPAKELRPDLAKIMGAAN